MKRPKWPDLVFSVGSFILSASLVPAVIAGTLMPLATTIPTTLVLSIFAFTFFNLKLHVSGVATVITVTLWAILMAHGASVALGF